MSYLAALVLSLSAQALEPAPSASDDADAAYDYGERAARCGYYAEQIVSYDGFEAAPVSLSEDAPDRFYALAVAMLNDAIATDLPGLEGDLSLSPHPYLQGADHEAALWFLTGSLFELNINDAAGALEDRYDGEAGDDREAALELFEDDQCRQLDTGGATTLEPYLD